MKFVGNDAPTVPPKDVHFMHMGDPRYHFLFGKEVLISTKRKPQLNKWVTDTEDQDPGCDGFYIGMMARGD